MQNRSIAAESFETLYIEYFLTIQECTVKKGVLGLKNMQIGIAFVLIGFIFLLLAFMQTSAALLWGIFIGVSISSNVIGILLIINSMMRGLFE